MAWPKERRVAFLRNSTDEGFTWDGFRRQLPGNIEVDVVNSQDLANYDFRNVSIVADCGGLSGRPEVIDAASQSQVRFWQIISTGVDHVDVARLRQNGISVANLLGSISATSLAEHALMLLLAVFRRLPDSVANARTGVMNEPLMTELRGKTIGLVGFGASARALAIPAAALGMRVVACDLIGFHQAELDTYGLQSFWVGPESVDDVISASDVVSLHTPLTPESRHLLNASRFERIREGAVIINVARGGLIDTRSMVRALQTHRIFGAGLDTVEPEPLPPNHELLMHPNVIITPHHAAMTPETLEARGEWAAKNICRFLDGDDPYILQ